MRPFCIATIGVILGIIMGLYLKSIALFVVLLLILISCIVVLHFIQRQSNRKEGKYIKTISIFAICFFSFWIYVSCLENSYDQINQRYDKQEVEIKAIVISNKVKKEYKAMYQIQVIEVRNNQNEVEKQQESKKIQTNQQKFNMILNLKTEKNVSLDLQYGDEILFIAIYEKPSVERNEGGFDYQQYLKTKKIVGITTTKSSNIKIIGKNKTSIMEKAIYTIRNNAVIKIKECLKADTANLCTGLLLGEKTELSENIQEDFRKSNLSHMLAISGAHVSYILLAITTVVQKMKMHKRWSKLLLIAFLLFFMELVGATPSVVRSCIMAILQLLAGILFTKSDTYQNLAISSFIILLINPYAILDIGFQLSFGGTMGIVIFSKRLKRRNVTKRDSLTEEKKDEESQERKLNDKQKNKQIKLLGIDQTIKKINQNMIFKKVTQNIIETIKEMCIVTLSANLFILPIMMHHFNNISLTFLISNVLASPILGISLILSMIFLIALLVFNPLAKLISIFLQPILQLLITVAGFSSQLPFSQILVPTPAIWQILLYYILIILIFLFKSDSRKNENLLAKSCEESRFYFLEKNISETLNSIKKYKKVILVFLILLIISPYLLKIIPNNQLKIYFIDVGQGDSMLIQTPFHKTILIDGGGSETGSFDVGEKTLIPYLLDKGIMKIDYMLFSHFDSDHCQGLLKVMEKLKVKNAVITKQGEQSTNYVRFLEIVKKRKIKIIVVQAGDKFTIDKSCSLDILFPTQELISTNVLNNNSMVARFTYQPNSSQKFNLLLTGDVEKIAEEQLISMYQNTSELQATILKVAHHGSKTSSTTELLELVKPKIALIGVGEKNTFGHPSQITLEKLDELRMSNL